MGGGVTAVEHVLSDCLNTFFSPPRLTPLDAKYMKLLFYSPDWRRANFKFDITYKLKKCIKNESNMILEGCESKRRKVRYFKTL